MEVMQEMEEIHLLDYVQIILKRKWIVIATFVFILTGTAFFTFISQPIYQSTAKIRVGKENRIYPPIKRDVEYWTPAYDDMTLYRTHAEMIRSFPVLYRAAKKLELNKRFQLGEKQEKEKPTFKEEIRRNIMKITSIVHMLFSIFQPEIPKNVPVSNDPLVGWANYLKGIISVSPMRNTRIITVSATDIDPVFCRDVVNAVCESYLDFLRDTRLGSFKKQLSFFSDELSKIKKRLEESEKRFYEFRQKEKIYSLKGKRQISSYNLSALSSDLIKTQVEKASLEEKLRELEHLLKSKRIEDFTPALLNNEILYTLKSDLIKAKIKMEELRKVYKEKHPLIIEAKARIQKIRESFIQELAKTIVGLKQEIAILARKEERLKAQMSDKERENLSLSGKELRYAMLEREVQTNRELYNALLANLKEMDVIKGLGEEDVKIIEKAQVPLYPIKPRPILNLTLGAIIGGMLGIGLAFFIEYMDLSIRDERDVERYLALPILSMVPKVDFSIAEKSKMERELTDSFLSLATNIKFYSVEKNPKVILITSANPGEGKTFTVTNLGKSLVRTGANTIVMDADLRNPSLGQNMDVKNRGITDFIRDFPKLENRGFFNENFSFGDVQRIIFAHGKSGIMRIMKQEKKIVAVFHEGELVDLYWENRPMAERMGQILMKQNVISEGILKDALTLSKSTKSKMGSVLLALDSINPERIEKIVDLHTKETFALINNPSQDLWEFVEGKFFHEETDDPLRRPLPFQRSAPFLERIVDSYIIPDPRGGGLNILPAGQATKNPIPFLTSKVFDILISILQNKFDYMLLDGPPVFFAEIMALSKYCDGYVLVLRSGINRPHTAKKAVDILKGTGKSVLGVVLNAVDVKKEGYYYHYYSYYPQVR